VTIQDLVNEHRRTNSTELIGGAHSAAAIYNDPMDLKLSVKSYLQMAKQQTESDNALITCLRNQQRAQVPI